MGAQNSRSSFKNNNPISNLANSINFVNSEYPFQHADSSPSMPMGPNQSIRMSTFSQNSHGTTVEAMYV